MKIWNHYRNLKPLWRFETIMIIWNLYSDLKPFRRFENLRRFETFMMIWNLYEYLKLYGDLKPLWIWNHYEDLKPLWRFETFMKIWHHYEDLKPLYLWSLETFSSRAFHSTIDTVTVYFETSLHILLLFWRIPPPIHLTKFVLHFHRPTVPVYINHFTTTVLLSGIKDNHFTHFLQETRIWKCAWYTRGGWKRSFQFGNSHGGAELRSARSRLRANRHWKGT